MWQFDTELSEVIRRTPHIKSFRFPVRAKGVRYLPGQFFFITIKVKGEDAIHHFSFSSSPSDRGYIEFTKRITQSDFSQALDVMQPGAWAHIQGPEGGFTLPRKLWPLAFLSGGIGITPLRSMLRYISAKGLAYDVALLYGNNTYEDIAFREELEQISRACPKVRVELILSGPEFPPGWQGPRGFIDSEKVKQLVPDYMQRLFYASGPPRMVIALEEQLKALGVPEKQVKRDSFTGYD